MLVLPPPAPPRTQLLAHVMPWFENRATSGGWGWHWTMNHFDPAKTVAGRPEAASHYRPLIGLYDSNDQDAVDCQILLMKFAGVDGVLVDWYGNVETYDYATNHRNTQRIFAAAKRAGLGFALVYEDQTVPQLIKNGKFAEGDAVTEGQKLVRWVAKNWFSSPTYIKQDGHPLFLVFGPQYYKGDQWTRLFEGISPSPAYYSLHSRKAPAIGAYDWPLPKEADAARARFAALRPTVRDLIPVAYPRFHDIYKEAGVGESYGTIPDLGGKTYDTTLTEALTSGARFAQIATWNDWGEGTSIEPSVEFGYRDLETTQRLVRSAEGRKVAYSAADLRLPARLYKLQKRFANDAKPSAQLSKVANLLFTGKMSAARTALDRLTSSTES